MGSDRASETTAPPACEHCGTPGPAAKAPASTPPAPSPDDAEQAETRCEWCGAEYPVPGAG